MSINPLNWHAFMQACECVLLASDPVWATGAATHTLPVATPPCDTQDAHIFVAEDHPINRELIAKQLRLLGYRVALVEDGVVALERLYEHCFNVLLTDCHTPCMDGLDLARHIRREEGDSPRLPIIAITATTLAGEHTRCRAVDMGASLLKPTTLATLQEALPTPCTSDAHVGAGGAAEEPPILSLDDLHAALGTDPVATDLTQVFLSSLADGAQRLQSLLDAMDRRVLRRWAHRTGDAPVLSHNPGVDAVAEAFRHVVHNGGANAIRAAGARTMRLLTHINELLSVLGSPIVDVVHRMQVTDS